MVTLAKVGPIFVDLNYRFRADNLGVLSRLSKNLENHLSQFRTGILSKLLLASFLVIAGCSSSSESEQQSSSNNEKSVNSSDALASQNRSTSPNRQTDRLEDASRLIESGEYKAALELVQAELVANPGQPEALRLAMTISGLQGNFLDAGEMARQLAEVDSGNAAEILLAAFDLHLRASAFDRAEQDLLLAEKADPKSGQVQRRLAQFLNAQGRRHEASQHVFNLIRLRVIQPQELLSLVDRRGPFLLMSFDEFSKSTKASLFELGKIRYRYSATRSDREADLLAVENLAVAFPQVPAVWAFYGRLLVELEKFDRIEKWLESVPEGIQQHPEYWNAIGLWMVQQERHDEAIRAFAEAINRDPGDRDSMRSMMSSLLEIGDEETATEIRGRLADLDRLFRIAKEADQEDAMWISKMLQEHARPWEASAWFLYAAQAGNQIGQVISELDQRHASITAWEQSATLTDLRRAKLKQLLGFTTSDWPMPDLSKIQSIAREEVPEEFQRGISMANKAGETGLNTTFVSDFPLDGSPMFPHQANGGGIAALDFDLDGHCDLYFVQSGGSPQSENSSQPNQLFRATSEGSYHDHSLSAGVAHRGFGQGVCAGDANQDGFMDLIVANIGPNVVYLNQGDGTFRQADDWLVSQDAVWTSSLALADLDGDRLPDLIEVNYIDDEQVFDRSCTDNYLDCQPQAFRKCADVIHRMKSEGGLERWSEGLLSDVSPKLGFGVVVANFDRKFGNDFFISNDGDLNHFWVSTLDTNRGGDRFQLKESGTLLGCSIGRGGNSQACMGIAFGDFNRDSTLDLHVTNFLEEPANLYLQSSNGTFIDEAMRYQVAEPSRSVLGFGTQAADFDNDGWLDLAVLNGHVFDGRGDDLPFRMKPQLMRGSKRGFVSQQAAEAGSYWTEKALGRTLVKLDWNRDGKMDLIANHLDAPVALLENQSEAMNWLQVILVGTESERDAIGAEVVVISDGERVTGWQTGGDGLMATNEQILHFGLSDATKIDSLEVRWPTGDQQTFEGMAANGRYLIVEGQTEWWLE